MSEGVRGGGVRGEEGVREYLHGGFESRGGLMGVPRTNKGERGGCERD